MTVMVTSSETVIVKTKYNISQAAQGRDSKSNNSRNILGLLVRNVRGELWFLVSF